MQSDIIIKIMSSTIDVIGIIIIMLMRFQFGLKIYKSFTYKDHLFNSALYILGILFITDIISWWSGGPSGNENLHYIIDIIYYTCHPCMGAVWVMYCHYIIYENKEKNLALIRFLVFPVILTLATSCLAKEIPIFYGIDSNNYYFRGPHYNTFILLNLFYIIYSLFLVYQGRKEEKNQMKYHNMFILYFYPILPIVGTILQTVSYGINVAWLCTAISYQIYYFNFQNSEFSTDPLTRLPNRKFLRLYIDESISTFRKKEQTYLYILMFDLDDFKNINDSYGHLEGDNAIIYAAKLLSYVTPTNAICARLGGDEFVITGTTLNPALPQIIADDLKEQLNEFNRSSKLPYSINISAGFSILPPGSTETKDEIMHRADNMMYEKKRHKKRENTK